MRVADAVGHTLVQLGIKQVFGVVGSGNFFVTNAMIEAGATYIAARHEHGSAMMADAYSRITDEVSAVSLHQGCGLTNAMTAITEAAKSRTPLVVLTGDTPPTAKNSNFWIEQEQAVRALGAEVERLHTPQTAAADAARAYHRARAERRTVVLNMPLDVQDAEVEWAPADVPTFPEVAGPGPSEAAVDGLAAYLQDAERPIIVGGRGARHARSELEALADVSGALLATSAVARGLFHGNPWNLDVMGGFASPEAADLIMGADLIVAFGASLNRWTARNGDLVQNATVVQVDVEPQALGKHRRVDHGLVGDTAHTASAVARRLSTRTGYRTGEVRERIAKAVSWQDVPFEDTSTDELLDPRTATIALDTLLPAERVVVPDAGNFCGYPAMFLSVPDVRGFCLPLAFQSIGLGLGAAVGAAVASPERIVVAGIGDGGFMMSLVELDTAVRLRLPILVVVYNDSAYGAEVHHFRDDTENFDTVVFPDTDIAAIARGFGCPAITVRAVDDLAPVAEWASGRPSGPMLIDVKMTSFPSWLEEHTFQGEK